MKLCRSTMVMPTPCGCRLLPSVTGRPTCFASASTSDSGSDSTTSTDQLRLQLDQLHAEAEETRAQANRARNRLMRLSESAEALKRQAYVSLHSGKENEARELLFQKKKVMQALEKLKSRIELLDKLSLKLNEARTFKEDQLMGNIALDLEVGREDASDLVEIKIPTVQEVPNDSHDEDAGIPSDSPSLAESQEVPTTTFEEDKNVSSDAPSPAGGNDFRHSMDDVENKTDGPVPNSWTFDDENSMINGLKGVSSYNDFLGHLDLQLNKIEAELVAILNVSALVLNDDDKLKNTKVQQTVEILDSIRAIRQKITNIK